MSTNDPRHNQSAPKSPYTDEWRGHREVYFLKVGLSLKRHEVDFALNVAAVEQLSKGDLLDAAAMLRRLADDLEARTK